MKLRLLLLLFVAALLALGTIGVACGGDGELTLKEYFRRIQAISDEFDERREPLDEALNQEFDSEAEEAATTLDVLDAGIPILGDFVDALDDLDAPAEVEDPHEEAVAAGVELVETIRDFTDRISDVESTSKLEELMADSELEAAGEHFVQACVALEDIADSKGIDIDLFCEETE